MQLLNCCRHDINIQQGDDIIVIPPSGIVVRIEEAEESMSKLKNGMQIRNVTIDKVKNLPEYKEGRYIIVPKAVAMMLKGRKDIIYPSGASNVVKNRVTAIEYLGRVVE